MAKKISKRAKKQILNIAFLVALIGITLTVVFVSQDINLKDIGNFLSRCNPWYIVGAFAGTFGFVFFEAVSLHLIVRKLGHKCKFRSSMAYSTSDLYYSAITPSATGGQPASMFYMMRDGVGGGIAGFSVLFNLVAYTVATMLVGVFGLVFRPEMFGQIGHPFAKTLIIIGFVIQIVLLALLIVCLLWSRAVLKIGNWGISLLAKMRIFKHPDKQREKLEKAVEKYRSCKTVIKAHPMLFFVALLFNVLQRASQTLVPCFVIMAVEPQSNMLDLFCMQAYVMIGYNSMPLPGGTGVYEYLYPNVYGICGFDMPFILAAMMVSRAISYYVMMIGTGLYTLVYHAVGIKKIKPDDAPASIDDIDIHAEMKRGIVQGGALADAVIRDEPANESDGAESDTDNVNADTRADERETTDEAIAESDAEINKEEQDKEGENHEVHE